MEYTNPITVGVFVEVMQLPETEQTTRILAHCYGCSVEEVESWTIADFQDRMEEVERRNNLPGAGSSAE